MTPSHFDNAAALPEGLVDKRIQQAIDFAKGSDATLKAACIAASPIVGTYSHGTQQIATARNRSVSTIENWAHAHWLYKELRRESADDLDFEMARFLWHDLPASHWWLAWDIQVKGYDARQYLENAAYHKWSGRDMMQEFKRDFEAGTAPMVLRRVFVTFGGLAAELLRNRSQLTPAQADAAESVAREFGE